MTLSQLNFTMRLDHAFERGEIAFVSAHPFLVPVRARADIQATESGELMIHYGNSWIAARQDQIKFVRKGT